VTRNLASTVEPHSADRVALRLVDGGLVTYGELRERAARLRGGLRSLGVVPGDRVALVCGNTPDFAVAYLAVLGLGAVVVPLNPTSPARELTHQLELVTPVAVLADPDAVPAWDQVSAHPPASVRHRVVTGDAAGGSDPGVLTCAELERHDPVPVVEVASDATAALMFTSGTAGSPRAAMVSHGNLLANLRQGKSVPAPFGPEDVVLGVLPLFHIFGMNVVLGASLEVGASVLMVPRFDPRTTAPLIPGHGVTVVPGVPSMWAVFANDPALDASTFASVRLALSGASKLPVSVFERCRERFGVVVYEGYGLTETSPIVTSSVPDVGDPRPGSIGRAIAGVEVRLVNSEGVDVLVGDIGEVLVRGDNVFQGYYLDPEATARVIDADGWLHTGDLATADDDGWLYIVDRAKDLVIVSGFNVYPAEVEDVLMSHPAVVEAGVVGVPHEQQGETVVAHVVLAEGAVTTEAELVEYAADHLARYKCPSRILFVDTLPRNPNGKLLRHALMPTP
jgi:long-chain acyl-CoA synthetase